MIGKAREEMVGNDIGIRDMTDADLVSVVEIVNREIAESPYVWAEIPVTVDARRQWLARHGELGQPAIVATSSMDSRVIGWRRSRPFGQAAGIASRSRQACTWRAMRSAAASAAA